MGEVIIEFERDCLIAILNSYHETDIAEKAKSATTSDLKKIGVNAAKYLGKYSLIDKMIAYGAVEFFEGSARDLRRKKRDLSRFPIHEESAADDSSEKELNLLFSKIMINK